MAVKLPTEKHQAETGWPARGTWLIFGGAKIGKTTFAAGWPDSLILNFEPGGTRYIKDAYCIDITSLDVLREIYGKLRASADKGELPYKTITLDAVDDIKDLIDKELMEELGTTAMGEAKKGFDWSESKRRLINMIKRFSQLPVNLLVIAHAKPLKLGDKVIGSTVDLPGQASSAVLSTVENILYCSKSPVGRQITPQVSAGIDSGSRNPTIEKIKSCKMTYADFREAFDKELEKEVRNDNGK